MIEHACPVRRVRYPLRLRSRDRECHCSTSDDLRRFIDLATWLTFNDYEWEVVRERTGLDAAAVTSRR